jgi:hypothetical protein
MSLLHAHVLVARDPAHPLDQGLRARLHDVLAEPSLSRIRATSVAQLRERVQEGPQLAPFADRLVACRAASHDFEAHPVGVCEKCGVVILDILGIELRGRHLDAERDEGSMPVIDRLAIGRLETKVVEARRVRVVWPRRASGSDRDLECAKRYGQLMAAQPPLLQSFHGPPGLSWQQRWSGGQQTSGMKLLWSHPAP